MICETAPFYKYEYCDQDPTAQGFHAFHALCHVCKEASEMEHMQNSGTKLHYVADEKGDDVVPVLKTLNDVLSV